MCISLVITIFLIYVESRDVKIVEGRKGLRRQAG